MYIKDVKNNYRFKHVNDPQLLIQEARIKKVPSTTIKLIINCGYIQYDEYENTLAIYHCDSYIHADKTKLLLIWHREYRLMSIKKMVVNKRRSYISELYRESKVIRVSKSIEYVNIYYMYSELLPFRKIDSYVSLLDVRVIDSEKKYFESKLRVEFLY